MDQSRGNPFGVQQYKNGHNYATDGKFCALMIILVCMDLEDG